MNIQQVVPFFAVSSMERSYPWYTNLLGFTKKHEWVVDGKLRWCWLALGGSAIMLQEIEREGRHLWMPRGPLGEGVSLYFICEDAIAVYDQLKARGVDASEPQVGNSMWVTSVSDPDGYRLNFESPTDVVEETKLSEVRPLTTDGSNRPGEPA